MRIPDWMIQPLMMVKMIQERRLILEFPLGRKFRRKWDWRKATEEVV